ncbi:MAG: glycine oxidase ThiO [Candidatus Krumholzibacteria bacterium]|nr:glycine oxidase ThiO [Candidatus Krumholzibacteria bacterium]MDH4338069.1 glycine oxidase ThiO [Candidatus Krumholzibacteria bacterium]MDH5270295.1 glycine oxidase ThiO [Candidatus Krumholzibacteria bacterium]
MSDSNHTPSVIVVGGGVIGLAVAWRLARGGATVTVIERGRAGRAASWVAAGMLAPISEAAFDDHTYVAFARASMARFPGFLKELDADSGITVGLDTQGTLVVARDRDDAEFIHRAFEYRRSIGLPVEWLTGSAAREREPALSPRVAGAMAIPDDHQIDTRALMRALVRACEATGVTVREQTEVTRIVIENDRVTGVETNAGHVYADTVVLAAGAWSGTIPGIPEHDIPPVRPVKGQLVRLRTDVSFRLRHVIRAPRAYLLPKHDGSVVVGATQEEMGFDLTPTAGGVSDILRHAWELVPGIHELPFEAVEVGLRPGSRDNHPVIGATGVRGLVMATGHFRHGILLAPATADAVAAGVLHGRYTGAEAFSPARFVAGQED